jgi:hypothetical protein
VSDDLVAPAVGTALLAMTLGTLALVRRYRLPLPEHSRGALWGTVVVSVGLLVLPLFD